MDYKELIERLKYYGTTYATGDNLGREIDGSDELMLTAATALETLLAERDAAAAVAHGRWKRNHQCQLYCSRCLEYQDLAIEKPYCSNCGAKMDKEGRNV